MWNSVADEWPGNLLSRRRVRWLLKSLSDLHAATSNYRKTVGLNNGESVEALAKPDDSGEPGGP